MNCCGARDWYRRGGGVVEDWSLFVTGQLDGKVACCGL